MNGFSIVVRKDQSPEIGMRLFVGRQWPDEGYPEGRSHFLDDTKKDALTDALQHYKDELVVLRSWTSGAL